MNESTKWDEFTLRLQSRNIAQQAYILILESLIRDFLGEDDCWLDEAGHCRLHGWYNTAEDCPHKRAKELLARGEG